MEYISRTHREKTPRHPMVAYNFLFSLGVGDESLLTYAITSDKTGLAICQQKPPAIAMAKSAYTINP